MTPLEDSILCRCAVLLAPTVTGEIMYMPGGVQSITPIAGGVGAPIQVLVDASGAAQLEAQRAALQAKGKRPYFDFNHSDGEASFWPEEFYWKADGIYCRGEWSADGKAKVEGKAWRQFSPVFHVDNKRAKPARIVCREGAKPNMGGLVNDPAFHTISPLWAKDSAGNAAGEPNQQTNNDSNMNEQELAALRAKNQELQTELDALKAKNADAAAISAKQSELRAVQAEINADANRKELEALKAKNEEQGKTIAARNRADAQAEVTAAVTRGAIAAKDQATQDTLIATATENPAFLSVIKAMQGQPALSGRITTPGSQVVLGAAAPNDTLKAYAAILAKNAEIKLGYDTQKAKGALAREAAALFARDIEKNPALADMTMEEAIKAADVSDANVGLLSGTLVLQRALTELMYEYPLLSSVATDFSDGPGLYGQTEVTRLILKQAVQTYDPTTDSSGRPKGWQTVSPAQTVDVPVTLDEHVGIPIVFGQTTLSKTMRNLFGEQANMALNTLGGYFVEKIAALMTAANFNAYASNSVGTGVTTSGSTAITVASTANMYPGQQIAGTGIPVPTFVASITSGTAAVLTQAATATGTGLTFTLNGGLVPTNYATYPKALNSFAMASLSDIAAALDVNKVPMSDRFALLNSPYYTKLGQDTAFNTFFAATRSPDIITDRKLPRLQGITPQNAPWFPSSNNRVGFAGNRNAVLIKSRLPQDFTQALGVSVPGSVTTVTAPSGISVSLVQYVNLQGGYAEWRPEVLLGAAVGDRRCGLVITSA